jgi:hypothetical protein
MKGKAYRKSAGTYAPGKTQKTDWVSWIMHAIVGYIIGVAGGIYFFNIAIKPQCHPIIGVGLAGAGIASIFGDRLFYGGVFKYDPVKNVRASLFARLLSALLIIGGIILAAPDIIANL